MLPRESPDTPVVDASRWSPLPSFRLLPGINVTDNDDMKKAKRGKGRPPLSPKGGTAKRIAVSVRPATLAAVRAEARRTKRSTSTIAREILEAHAPKPKGKA
jgi:hypothetical protein